MKLRDLLDVCLVSKQDVIIYVFNQEKREYELFSRNQEENMMDYFNRLSKIKEYEVIHLKPICVAGDISNISGCISVFAKIEVCVSEF